MTTNDPAQDLSPSRKLAARVRARRALFAQSIAEGEGDIVTDRPLTADERTAYGLDEEDRENEVDDGAIPFEDLVAWAQSRRELVAQAIAEGTSDIVPDAPLTPAERYAIGLDDEDDDVDLVPEGDASDLGSRTQGSETVVPRR